MKKSKQGNEANKEKRKGKSAKKDEEELLDKNEEGKEELPAEGKEKLPAEAPSRRQPSRSKKTATIERKRTSKVDKEEDEKKSKKKGAKKGKKVESSDEDMEDIEKEEAEKKSVTRGQKKKKKSEESDDEEVSEKPKKPAKKKSKKEKTGDEEKKEDNKENKKEEGEKVGEEKKEEKKEGEEEEEEVEVEGNKKRAAKKKGKAKKKKAAKPADLTVFKKGKWNPKATLLTADNERDSLEEELINKCCVGCSNRNPIRAVLTNNSKLFENCLNSTKISTLYDNWSAEICHNSFYYAATTNNVKMLIDLFKRQDIAPIRARPPNYLINYLDTGMVSTQAYGVRVRKVQMARGNRQGNNAFLEKQVNSQMHTPEIIQEILQNPNVEISTLEKLMALLPGVASQFYDNIIYAIVAGNRKIAAFLIDRIKGYTNYGFGNLHYEVLDMDNESLEEFHKASIHKKAVNNDCVTPTHCACVNPNAKYIRALMKADPNIQLTDVKLRKPIHYAASCKGHAPLEYVISIGANVNDLDHDKRSPLHYAAMFGRAKNVEILADAAPLMLKAKDNLGMMPMHYACEKGHLEAVKMLVEKGANMNVGAGSARMSPLAHAAAHNHYDVCEYLISEGTRVLTKDKFKRSPLIMAVRNGNAKIASLLLQHGALWDEPDSSGNTPLHYSAAYGWMQCVDLLLQIGADVNANSSWKITPLNVAMLKNHYGMVKHMLNQPGIDVNCKDEKGRTLISLAVELDNDEALEYIEYLLKEKNADPNVPDLQGLTPLHYLVAKQIIINDYIPEEGRNMTPEESRKKKEESTKRRRDIILLLIKYKANVSTLDNSGLSLFDKCLSSKNYELMDIFIDAASFGAQQKLLFSFSTLIYDPRVRSSFDLIMKKSPPSAEIINMLDDEGFTPFLRYLKEFVNSAGSWYQLINNYILFEVRKRKYEGEYDFSKEKLNICYANYIENKSAYTPNYSQISTFALTHSDVQLINKISNEEFQNTFMKVIIDTLQTFINLGAKPDVKVGKLKQYREPSILNQLIAPPLDTGIAGQIAMLPGRLQQIINPIGSLPALPIAPVKEYGQFGLWNAWHFVGERAIKEIVEFLEKLNVPIDDGNYDGDTPFMKSLNSTIGIPYMGFDSIYPIFKKHKADIDKPNSAGVTPFLYMIQSSNFILATTLATDGANVNANDLKGNFALKYTVSANNVEYTKTLLEKFKANPNKVDTEMRTVLHIAINNSSPKIDSTSEMENLLLENGADVNAIDIRGRTPLHYAFVKLKTWEDNSVIDPIEAVTTLCSKININVDVPDKWKKTPLHYAAQRSSTICSVFLLNRGSNLEALDIYGNTPLAVAFLNNHPDYAITLIERSADVKKMVHAEVIEDEKKTEDKKKEKEKKKMERMTDINDMDDYEEEEDEEMLNENNVNNQNNFGSGSTLFNTGYNPYQRNRGGFNNFGNNFNNGYGNNVQPQPGGKKTLANRTVNEGEQSMFRVGIRMGWQGLLYLLLDKNYDYMRGMEDALSELKFQLLLNLLRKTAKDEIVQRFNDKGQNLMHILAMHSNTASFVLLNQIYAQFEKRGVKHMAIDTNGRSALHYAVSASNTAITRLLLGSKYDVNSFDKEGNNAITLTVLGEKVGSCYSMIPEILSQNCDINILYKEAFYNKTKNGKKDEKKKDKEEEKAMATTPAYLTTPLIHAVRYRLKMQTDIDSILSVMFSKGADAALCDSDGRDIFMYIAKENSHLLLNFVIQHVRNYKKNAVDKTGRSALHYAVKQYELGSYQNTMLLDMLLAVSFDYSIKDTKGYTPIDYAVSQKNSKMADVFRTRGIDVSKAAKVETLEKARPISEWPIDIDYAKDAEEYLKSIEDKVANELEKQKTPVDPIGNQNEPLEVVNDSKGEPYDAYLNKVDLRNGVYGEYLFYRMQLIRNTNRDVYMVYTRWGRIGENGMFQKTPLGGKDEAASEFEKIFRAKSGNDWSERHQFVKQKHKYVLMNLKKQGLHYKQLLRDFNYKEIKPKSTLSPKLQKLMKLIVNVSLYEKAMTQFGIDTDELPAMRLKKESLLECKSLLEKIQEHVEILDKERCKGFTADFGLLEETYNEVNDLSSKYYEILPQSRYKDYKPPPLDNISTVRNQFTLVEDLLNIEAASKILLGAQSKLEAVHPWDYCYNSLGARLVCLDKEGEEYEIIRKYIGNSQKEVSSYNSYGNPSGVKIHEIFRVQRRGEQEKFEEFVSKENRLLLFHGSKTSNFLGILLQGLRVAPPNVAITGWAFGRGIYFADMFSKSSGYCYTYGGQNESEMLMAICEVALGNMSHPEAASFTDEAIPSEFDSVKAIGSRGPDPKGNLYLEDGAEIPLGEITTNDVKNRASVIALNEYVVFKPDQIKMRYLIRWSY